MAKVRSHRRVAAAVDAVCDVAATAEALTVAGVIAAVAQERGRPIDLDISEDLAGAVCGQRRVYPDRDVVVVASGLPDSERTLAHELGHIVFQHEGVEVRESALAVDDDLISYMLSQRTTARAEGDVVEWEAETFAAMLLLRLARMRGRGNSVSVARYDEAIG